MSARDNILRFTKGQKLRNFTLIDRTEATADSLQDGDVLKPLGEGGSAYVYLARQELFGQSNIKRAIKFFIFRDDVAKLRELDQTPVSMENFVSEIAALSDLNHRNLIKIFDAGIYDDNSRKIPFIVYDFVNGQTLKDYSVDFNDKNFNVDYFVNQVLDMCEGVKYLHDSGYFHYDIAPKNIFCAKSNLDVFIVGDLGLASRHDKLADEIFVIGSKDWMPKNAQDTLNTTISKIEYQKFQPSWDVYGLAKTIEHVLNKGSMEKEHSWVRDIKLELQNIILNPEKYTIDSIIRRIKFASPNTREVFGVPELSPGMTDKQITLMPVHALISTKRVERLISHPAIQRLSKVPQLTAAYRHFPSANHTRLEHSLGVMEVMRRYLVSVINEKYAISHLSQMHIETALIAALLSNIHQFAFTNVLNEISITNNWKPYLGKEVILEKILNQRDNGDLSLRDKILELFPNVDIDVLRRIIVGETIDDGERLIFSMLNSSIDARVVDYIARDSYHLGIGGYRAPDDEIFQFLTLNDGRIALNVRGISAAEQIIAQRYWLFNRFYWNRPNRRYVSLLRTLILKLGEDANFVQTMFDTYSGLDHEEALQRLEKQAISCADKRIASLAPFVRESKDYQFKIRYDFNLTEKSSLGPVFSAIDEMSNDDRIALDKRVGDELFGKNDDLYSVMIDLPKERGAKKSGDDVRVVFKKGQSSDVTLLKASTIVKGIKESYDDQLRHLRVSVHPKIELSEEQKGELEESIDILLSRET